MILDGGRCVGVEFRAGNGVEQTRAAREVIVCAGALESPKLLLLSGIGPAEQLRGLGIDVAVDLPGVGENLHDHSLVPLVYSTGRPVPPTVPGLTPLHAHLFWRSRPGLVVPDQQPLFFHIPLYFPGMSGPEHGFTLFSGLIRRRAADRSGSSRRIPKHARSSIRASSPARPTWSRTSVASSSAGRSAPRPRSANGHPRALSGPDVRSRDAIRDYIRRQATTYQHVVGTCRMGVDATSVVDPELRVHGVEGLRVADASVMPAVTSGNTHAPTTMIAERAAELLTA